MANIMRSDPFEDLFRGFFVRPVEYGTAMDGPSMKIDVREKDDAYTVHAELPGVKKEDIHVQIEGSTVSISAERKHEREVKDGERVLRTERSFGKVSRSFDLGVTLDESKACAKFNDGVLELTLPHKTITQAKKLMIS
ncbi:MULTISPECIES: Hsp20/alpha crystallin family protein [unclassified Uliginosibacterium]|uniref:Hsp20/alpha crystallin family protein n=1 Tax=unclassified Uliginosibacterium TaxID=2621521 RepID=UPI000C7E7860|nr:MULTISPECIES: Hsp20/alpha crystallin family protein [unclassified Uliginosibacterium]MDO6385010.1 Hsp20/alpha crystallin family protein [Uliginosibacterium sp. 31-12]PLK48693.1 heat-shock protein Hsp20 [Uliginosibacterium sp. TH139]